MEIIIPKYNKIKLRGYVKVDLFHPDDIHEKEPLFHDEGENTVQNWLLGEIVDHIDGSDSGASAYHLTSTGWFDDPHGEWPQGETYHDQRDKHGMFIDANTSVPYGGNTQAFFLNASVALSQPNAYTARWVAEGTWNLQGGSGSSGSITAAYLGKDWSAPSNANSVDTGSFDSPFANYTISAFTMQQDDKVKITWDIAVDQ